MAIYGVWMAKRTYQNKLSWYKMVFGDFQSEEYGRTEL